MNSYGRYVDRLERLVFHADLMREVDRTAAIAAALDGEPSAELRRRVSVARLRSAGAFFTGSALATRAIAAGFSRLPRDAKVLDPACGVGDLLVAVAGLLPLTSNLTSTLEEWGWRIFGRDLEREFVRATKLRLALTAIRRNTREPIALSKLPELFPGLDTGSSLADEELFAGASHIAINPPFTIVPAPDDCEFASGTVNSAAVFMDRCVCRSEPGAQIVAILPEVLRSGSRYEKWRKLFEQRVTLTKVEVFGQFDRHTDVDVFIAVGKIRRKSIRRTAASDWGRPARRNTTTIGQEFDVSVGPVVPYRDPHKGPWCPFINARELPAWTTVSSVSQHRRFKGRTYDGPFVVVRRTSRPGDTNRAVGTVVTAVRSVAVENHLLVLQPKERSVAICKQLVRSLRCREVDNYLNRRIRCRHLTVSALAELPWREK